MFHNLTTRLSIAAALAVTGSAAVAANVPIDVTNSSNGLTGIFSITFDGGVLPPCGGGSSVYCPFFGGEPGTARNISEIPDPSGVVNNVPGGIGPTGIPVAPAPASGSFLDLTLTNGDTELTLGQSSVTFGVVDICITKSNGCSQVNAHAVDAGVVFNAPQPLIAAAMTPAGGGSTGTATVPVDSNGKAVFMVQNVASVVVDFSSFSQVVTICTDGPPTPACGLITTDTLSLDVIRYVLEIDYDPTFTFFTGRFIGQTSNKSLLFLRLNSAGADQDGDGVVDTADNCPTESNAAQTNSDIDPRGDACDNCSATANTDAGQVAGATGTLKSQLDFDRDGYGNICDGDINNTSLTTSTDYTLLRNRLNQAYLFDAQSSASDMNGTGLVTSTDYTLLRNRLNTAPGPSGYACATLSPVTVPCPLPPMP